MSSYFAFYGKYFDEFYKPAICHFIFSASCAALFVLGMEYSRGEDGDDILDYYIPSMILSAIQFILTIVSMLLFAVSRGYRAEIKSYGSRPRKSYHRLKSIHVIGLMLSFLWGIVGAVITAVCGVCKKDEKCSYAVNMQINRALAIIIIVIHSLSTGVSYFILTTSRSQSRTEPVEFTVSKKNETKAPPTIALRVNTSIEQTRKKEPTRKMDTEQTKKKEPEQFVLQPRMVKRSMSDISRRNRQYYDDSLIGRPIKRPPRVNDNHIDSPKPLPKKNKKLLFPAVGKVVFQYTTLKNKNNANNDHESRVPSVPAPSYNDVISGDANTSPYYLPPLPVDQRDMHTLPDNMYIGSAYPDTEIMAVKPHEVSRH